MEIKFIVLKNNIYQTPKRENLVCNNSDYTAFFTFDSAWNGIAKTARFTCYGNSKRPIETFDVPIVDGKCKVPPIQIAGKVTVGVFGGDIKSTDNTVLTFVESPLCDTPPIAEPQTNIYNKIMTLFEKYYLKSAKIEQSGELVFERGDGTTINAGSCDGITVVGESAQSDWSTTDENDPSFVKNKPILENEVNRNSENAVSSFAIYNELSKKIDSPKREGLEGQVLRYGTDGAEWSEIDQLEVVSIDNVKGLGDKLSEVEASFEKKLNEVQIQVVQPTPLFANDISECTDTTKLYVLPDGYIYAYMNKTETISPTNRIPLSIGSDGSPFNGTQGWKTGCSLNAGTGAEYTTSNTAYYEVTGFIPVKATDTFRIKDYEFASPAAAYDNICFYDSSFGFIKAFTNSSAANPLSQFIKGDGTIEACISNAATTNFTSADRSAIAYMRLSAFRILATTFLTINEPLESSSSTYTGWHNTGHAFVPADYENDIIDLKERVSAVEAAAPSDGVESYVVAEAQKVAGKVYKKQNANTFTFLAISDAHYLPSNENIVA